MSVSESLCSSGSSVSNDINTKIWLQIGYTHTLTHAHTKFSHRIRNEMTYQLQKLYIIKTKKLSNIIKTVYHRLGNFRCLKYFVDGLQRQKLNTRKFVHDKLLTCIAPHVLTK